MQKSARDLIKKWHKVSQSQEIGEADEFFRFIASWVSFSAFISNEFGEDSRGNVKKWASQSGPQREHKRLMASDNAYRKSAKMIEERGVSSPSGTFYSGDSTSLREVMDAVYTVRNNLFHGGKSPTNYRDQNLVRACFYITQCLVEYELSKNYEY